MFVAYWSNVYIIKIYFKKNIQVPSSSFLHYSVPGLVERQPDSFILKKWSMHITVLLLSNYLKHQRNTMQCHWMVCCGSVNGKTYWGTEKGCFMSDDLTTERRSRRSEMTLLRRKTSRKWVGLKKSGSYLNHSTSAYERKTWLWGNSLCCSFQHRDKQRGSTTQYTNLYGTGQQPCQVGHLQ